ncbi:MAG: DedA family protein [Pseudomonadota bacterium]
MTVAHLSTLVADYGYLVVFAALLLAGAGVPLPAGELLIAAAIYAAHTHRLSIVALALGGAGMATLGGVAGYGVGRLAGAAALARYGGVIGLGPARLRLGRYLFLAHGGKIVFFLRFVALLGPFGGVLAGTNRMPLPRFMVFNALGATVWAGALAVGGYVFGAFFQAVGRPAGLAAVAFALALVAGVVAYIHRQESALQAKADAMLL